MNWARAKMWLLGAAALVAAVTVIGKAGAWVVKNRPVLQPVLEEAIVGTKTYHDQDIETKLRHHEAVETERLRRLAAEMGQKQAEAMLPVILEAFKKHEGTHSMLPSDEDAHEVERMVRDGHFPRDVE